MNGRISEVLNSYIEYKKAKQTEEDVLQGLVGQEKVYEKMLQGCAFEYEKYNSDFEEFEAKLNRVLVEKLSGMSKNLHLQLVDKKYNKGLAKLVFDFLGNSYDVYSSPVVDTSLYNGETQDLTVMVQDFGAVAELLNVWLFYSEDLEDLKSIMKKYSVNPEDAKRIYIEKFISSQRQEVYDKIAEYQSKEADLREELDIVDKLIFSSVPLKENLLNKILYRDQIRLQQRQRNIVNEIESIGVCINGYHEVLQDGTIEEDAECLFNEDMSALSKLFSLLEFLEKRGKTIETYNAKHRDPIFEKRKKLTDRISKNRTQQTAHIVAKDELKFAYKAYLQEMFKDAELAIAIMNLNREDLDAELWEAAKALKKFIGKYKVLAA